MAGYSVTYTVVDNATKQIDTINRRIAQMRAPLDRMQRSVARFVDVSGLRKVATGFDWIYKAAGSVLRTLTAIVPVMGAITGAASIAGMVKLVQSYSNWSHALVQSADNIGITTQELQKFQDATRLAGGNADDMTNGLKSLHDKLGDLNIGRGSFAETAQMLEHLGVNFRDANGHIKTNVSELMPELIRKLAAVKDPLDRARMAQGLLGEGGEKLVETFRQSSQSFGQWFSDVDKYKTLTDEQKRSLQLFTEAQGKLGVQFDRMGEQISAMVARDFGPLLQRFSDFVEKNTPAILAAVDELSKRFAAWVGGIDWAKVQDGVNSFIETLKFLWNHLDTIKTVVEGIAILFAVKWAVGIVGSIAQVVGAIGSAGETGSLLGKLAMVTSAATLAFAAWQKAQNPATYDPKNLSPNSPFWRGMSEEDKAKHGADQSTFAPWVRQLWDRAMKGPAELQPGYRPPGAIQKQSATGGYLPGGVTHAAFSPGGGGGVAAIGPSEFWDSMARAVTKGFEDAFDHITGFAGGGGAGGAGGGGGFQQAAFHTPIAPAGPSPNIGPGGRAPEAPLGLPPGVAGKAPELLGQLAGDTSWGDYGTRANNPGNMNYASWQKASGRFSYMDQTEGRQHTMAVYNTMQEGVADAYRLMLRKQEQHGKTIAGALSAWSTTPGYAEKIAGMAGLDPNAPLDLATADPATVQRLMAAQFKMEGRRGSHTATGEQILGGINLGRGVASAPPVASAKAVTVPPPQAPNGNVDVNITHKNPPPNSAVTASGSGAVNVAPVRVEHQNMADI